MSAFKVSPEKFLALHTLWAQQHANTGRVSISLYRDGVGKPRLLLEGWPHPKSWIFLATLAPQHNKVKPIQPRLEAQHESA